jgi:tetratricopeptide (TPR) repeat protein
LPDQLDQEDAPTKNIIVRKKSPEYRSKQRRLTTQATSSGLKDSQAAYRNESTASKNIPSGGYPEHPRQTDRTQKRTEEVLASRTPSSKSLTRKRKPEVPVNPNTLKALDWLKKSNDSIARGDVLETIVTASVAIKLDPKLLKPYLNRAWAFSERRLYDKAIMDLSRAIQMDPGNAFVYNRRGLIFQRKGDDRKAVADYEKACKLGLELGCKNYQKYASHLRD